VTAKLEIHAQMKKTELVVAPFKKTTKKENTKKI
jgi:hypothetical protein